MGTLQLRLRFRMTMSPTANVFTMVAAAICVMWSASSVAARSDWRELTVGHFHLFSTLRDSRTREVARQLQAFEKTVGELIQGPDALPDTPTLVYLLSASDFDRYAAGRPGLGGLFAERRYYNVMAVNADMDFDYAKVAVLHEYTHYIQRSTQTIRMPPWFVEGYAELISSFELHGNSVTIGGTPLGTRIELSQWIPVERVLAVKVTDPEYRAETLMRTFYGEAWALVHLLIFDNEELRRSTEKYLRNMDVGLSEPDAFSASFAFDKKSLDAQVRTLVLGRKIHVKRFTYQSAIAVDDAPISRMTAAQADAALVRMVYMIDPRRKALGELAASALRESPTDPAMRALAARIAVHEHEQVELGDLIDQLGSDPSVGSLVRVDVADALLSKPESSPEDARKAAQVIEPLIRATEPMVEAVAFWAYANSRAGDSPDGLIPLLEAASRRVPHNTQLLNYLASANVAKGDLGKAKEWYNRIMLVSTSPEERLWAQKQADSPRMQRSQPVEQ